jgi:hypothetical protein
MGAGVKRRNNPDEYGGHGRLRSEKLKESVARSNLRSAPYGRDQLAPLRASATLRSRQPKRGNEVRTEKAEQDEF